VKETNKLDLVKFNIGGDWYVGVITKVRKHSAVIANVFDDVDFWTIQPLSKLHIIEKGPEEETLTEVFSRLIRQVDYPYEDWAGRFRKKRSFLDKLLRRKKE